jgi:transposase-like protein
MAIRKRQKYTPEFKADAVRLCKAGGKSVAEVGRQLGVTEKSLREGVQRAAPQAPETPAAQLATAERVELGELRRRVKRLEMERD